MVEPLISPSKIISDILEANRETERRISYL